jgi:hypothetical protein
MFCHCERSEAIASFQEIRSFEILRRFAPRNDNEKPIALSNLLVFIAEFLNAAFLFLLPNPLTKTLV